MEGAVATKELASALILKASGYNGCTVHLLD